MPSRFRALAVALAVGASGLPACVPPAAEYTESEWTEESAARPRAGAAHGPLRAGLQPNPAGRSGAAARHVASAGIVPSDRVVVAVAGPPALAGGALRGGGRAAAAYGIVASPAVLLAAPAERGRHPARALRRDVAAMPQLEQAGRRRRRFHEYAFQQFRLRRRSQSRPDGGNAGRSGRGPAARSDRCTSRRRRGERYRLDKVQLPAAANIGPIAVPANQTPPLGRRNERLGSGRHRRAAMIAEPPQSRRPPRQARSRGDYRRPAGSADARPRPRHHPGSADRRRIAARSDARCGAAPDARGRHAARPAARSIRFADAVRRACRRAHGRRARR